MPKKIKGTNKADKIIGSKKDDLIEALGGNDVVDGGKGDDIIRGGYGKDTLKGGKGNDILYGDHSDALVTTYSTTTLNTGETLSISLSVADGGRGDTVNVAGWLGREEVTSETLDLMFAIDISGSSGWAFSGDVNIEDKNGDGSSNTVLDAEIAAFEALHASILNDAVLPNALMTIVPFDDGVGPAVTFSAAADLDNNGIYDVIEYVRSLQVEGGTDFFDPLDKAVDYFSTSTAGQKMLYFLSDGGADVNFEDEVAALNALDVDIEVFGLGDTSDEDVLDLIDDFTDNDTATIVLDPSLLSSELLDPGIESTEILSIAIEVNGVAQASIDPASLAVTPLGLRYFDVEVGGLKVKKNDVVRLVVVAADGASTELATAQVVEDLKPGKPGDDLLDGGDGDDQLYGGEKDDLLRGGAGADLMDGGSGIDWVDFKFAAGSVGMSLATRVGTLGEALGDIYVNIENVRGSIYDDRIAGDQFTNVLDTLGGNDEINAGAGGDVILSGGGNDDIDAGEGDDWVEAGKGDDEILAGDGDDYIDAGKGDDTIQGEAGDDLILAGDGNDYGYGGEGEDVLDGGFGDDWLYGNDGEDFVVGNLGNDYLYGNDDNDVLWGSWGDDRIYGGNDDDKVKGDEGNDSVYGDNGNDIVDGGLGKDYVNGGYGDDKVIGGKGKDTLYGGSGMDLFVFKKGYGKDLIYDFDLDEFGEMIDISSFKVKKYKTLKSMMTDTYDGVKISFGKGDVLTLNNVEKSDLQAADFIL